MLGRVEAAIVQIQPADIKLPAVENGQLLVMRRGPKLRKTQKIRRAFPLNAMPHQSRKPRHVAQRRPAPGWIKIVEACGLVQKLARHHRPEQQAR